MSSPSHISPDTELAIQLNFDKKKNSKWAYQDAWAKLLTPYPWEWFVTLTFSEDVHPEAANKLWRLWVSQLGNQLHGKRQKAKKLTWVCATEKQKSGRIHFHALLIGVKQARRLSWMDHWEELGRSTGYARIEEVKTVQGASRYLCKYLAKDGEIDWSNNFRNLLIDLFPEMEPSE